MDKFSELEKFADAYLKQLPLRSAPESLAANVTKAIENRKALPWWEKNFTEWNFCQKMVATPLLVGSALGTGYLAFLIWELSLISRFFILCRETMRPLFLLLDFIAALFGSFFTVLNTIDKPWLYSIVGLAVIGSVACLSVGSFLVRAQFAKSKASS
jgi:hypothetical protein